MFKRLIAAAAVVILAWLLLCTHALAAHRDARLHDLGTITITITITVAIVKALIIRPTHDLTR
ncbi:hypothetical protein [Mycobacterium sp.]|uniref:hypothetical protein n=1 Tax=Mycobacterium sp. TaxID=1785 RepID=UPI0031E12E3E